MTTKSQDGQLTLGLGDMNDIPVISSEIIYKTSAVGSVLASGHARPLTTSDRFEGFCIEKADNSTGSAADINCRIQRKGQIKLSVTGAVITDIGRPVYASDDNTFALAGIGVYIGRVTRFISAGVCMVSFDADRGEEIVTVAFSLLLAGISDGDVITTFTPGFNGRVKSMDFITSAPVTTGSKLSTLNAEIGTTDITGGEVALTSAACTPLGAIVAGAAITAGAGFDRNDTISIEASSTTTFIEGSGTILLTLGK